MALGGTDQTDAVAEGVVEQAAVEAKLFSASETTAEPTESAASQSSEAPSEPSQSTSETAESTPAQSAETTASQSAEASEAALTADAEAALACRGKTLGLTVLIDRRTLKRRNPVPREVRRPRRKARRQRRRRGRSWAERRRIPHRLSQSCGRGSRRPAHYHRYTNCPADPPPSHLRTLHTNNPRASLIPRVRPTRGHDIARVSGKRHAIVSEKDHPVKGHILILFAQVIL